MSTLAEAGRFLFASNPPPLPPSTFSTSEPPSSVDFIPSIPSIPLSSASTARKSSSSASSSKSVSSRPLKPVMTDREILERREKRIAEVAPSLRSPRDSALLRRRAPPAPTIPKSKRHTVDIIGSSSGPLQIPQASPRHVKGAGSFPRASRFPEHSRLAKSGLDRLGPGAYSVQSRPKPKPSTFTRSPRITAPKPLGFAYTPAARVYKPITSHVRTAIIASGPKDRFRSKHDREAAARREEGGSEQGGVGEKEGGEERKEETAEKEGGEEEKEEEDPPNPTKRTPSQPPPRSLSVFGRERRFVERRQDVPGPGSYDEGGGDVGKRGRRAPAFAFGTSTREHPFLLIPSTSHSARSAKLTTASNL